jgi:hypothetical protein
MKRWLAVSALSALVALSTITVARAQGVTQPFIYQGFLTQSGTPVHGVRQMQFRIYNALGTLRWSTVPPLTVNVSNGLFTVQLNTDISIWTGEDLFLEIQIDPPSGPILSPRVRIGSTPYANTATLLNLFQERTDNPDRMVITHSPAFPTWGLQYRDSDDSFHFLAGGTTVLRVGLRGPTALQIPAGAAAGRVLTSDAFGNASWQDPPAGTSVWAVSGANIYNTNPGNVGIGTNTPTVKLQVRGDLLVDTSAGSLRIGFPAAANQWLFNTIGGGANLQLWENAADAVRMFFAAGGNIGIGTINPAARLDILGGNWNTETTEGDLRVGDATYRLKIGIATGGSGAGHATIAAQGGVNALSLGAGTTLAAQRTLTILGTGRVGIGTATPSYRLHVVEGSSPGRAVYGEATANSGLTYGGYFLSASTSGTGVFGWASATTGAAWGVWGRTSSTDSTAYGVRGEEPSDGLGHAVYAFGSLAAMIKSFQIDHPLDPENYYLNHFCTEAPEPLNAYSGNVITDAQGYAVVQLPPYFESINRDFRYQLTVIDGSDEFVLAKVVRKIQNNQFVIRTSKPFVEVSWRVEAVRNDLWVQRYGFQTEQEKEDEIKGRYLHPELYGQPKERGIHYRPEPEPAPNETAKP